MRTVAQVVNPNAPWTNLAPSDVALLIDTGVPDEAISDEGTLDVEMLRSLGWTVTDQELDPPAPI